MQTVAYLGLVIPRKPSTGRHRNEFLRCLGGTVFFFMNLSAVNKQAEQTVLMLTYKYVVVGKGGRGAIIVSGSKHACLIISCNIPVFILQKAKTIPYFFAATRQTLSHPRNSYASLSIPGGITGPFYD